jgi:ankyrin repeat protein
MTLRADYLEAFEVHSPDLIRKALAAGASAVDPIGGKKPIDILIEMYLRSARFADCLRVMLDAGAVIEDPLIEAVLLDDDAALRRVASAPGQQLDRRLDLVCTFTPCTGVSALHLCAEFNSVRCATALLKAGLDVNARAAIDADGLGGQTPLFHAVNSNLNYCRPVMELLVDAGADLDLRLKGLVWGRGFDWETTVFDVTPMSYAQCGLYRQFHRREEDIFGNIALMYRKRYGTEPPIHNVPNRYLRT